jgi:hypothetical protein
VKRSKSFGWALGAGMSAALVTAGASPGSAHDDSFGSELIQGCQWQEQIIALDGAASPQQISFRWQRCDGTSAARVAFRLVAGNTLVQTWDGHEAPVAQFWPLAGRRPSEKVIEVAGATVAPSEKGRCLVRLDASSGRYSFEPDVALMEDYLAKEEPFGACGEYGFTNDAIQYFDVIDKALLAFFWVGQDTPLFDPGSFRLVDASDNGAAE